MNDENGNEWFGVGYEGAGEHARYVVRVRGALYADELYVGNQRVVR